MTLEKNDTEWNYNEATLTENRLKNLKKRKLNPY